MFAFEALLLLVLCSTPASARIGESKDQMDKRHGKPEKHEVVNARKPRTETLDRYDYRIGDIAVTTYFKDGTCVRIAYFAPVTVLTDLRIGMLLEKNAGTERWTESQNIVVRAKPRMTGIYWKRSDGAMAEYWIAPTKTKRASLVIQLKDHVYPSWLTRWAEHQTEESANDVIADF